MGFKEALERAQAERPKPVLQQVAVGDELFSVEVRRLDGMEWAGVMAECPPVDAAGARLGYDADKAAVVACKRYSRLLDADGEPVDDFEWDDLFAVISGVEVKAIAAIWWAMNMSDPNERVAELKKASRAGVKTSSN